MSSGLLLVLPKIAEGQSNQNIEATPQETSLEGSFNPMSNLNKTDFVSQIGTSFTIAFAANGSSSVTLFKVEDLPQMNNEKGFVTEGFSLLFSTRRRQNLYHDAYIVSHQTLGSFQLLLVPVLMSQGKPILCYEAIINRFV
jgi:hypothetical protein